MEMDENVYMALEPLVNQLLFGNQNKPTFNLGKSELSNEFMNVIVKHDQKSFTELLEKFEKKQIEIALKGFNQNNRINVLKIILNDQVFNDSIVLLNLIKNGSISKSDIKSTAELIELELGSYVLSGNVSANIILYFKLFFEELFYYQFSNINMINQNEYLDLLSRFTNEKSII